MAQDHGPGPGVRSLQLWQEKSRGTIALLTPMILSRSPHLHRTMFTLRVLALFACCIVAHVMEGQEQDVRQWVIVSAADSTSVGSINANDLLVLQDGHKLKTQPNVLQQIPLRLGLLFDESGSGRRFPAHELLLEHILDWAGETLRIDGGDAFLIGFNDQIITSTEVTTDISRLRVALRQLRPIGGSAVIDAIIHSSQKFTSIRPEAHPIARVLVLVSDGIDNASYAKERTAIEAAQRSGARIYTIALPSVNASGKGLLKYLTKETGGQAFFPINTGQLDLSLAAIARDLESSFLLGFIPETRDGKAHKLAVESATQLHLRYPPAFFAAR